MIWTAITYRIGVLSLALILFLMLIMASIGLRTPTCQEIAYVSKKDGATWDVYLMDIDRRLSYNATGPFMPVSVRNRLPAWSPDGQQLAIVSSTFGGRRGMDILLMQMSPPAMWVLTNTISDETAPVWSPANVGSQRIAFALFNGLDWDIDVRRSRDNNVVLIQDGEKAPFLRGPHSDMMPRWSPDGQRLYFISNRHGGRDFDLYSVDANGRGLRRITEGLEITDYLEISPTGTHAVFVSEHDMNNEIYIANLATGAVTNLSRNRANDTTPVWSSDGTRIAFVSDRDGDEEIYVMTMLGDDLRQMTDNIVYDYGPAWSPDGRFIIYISVPQVTSELYLLDVETGQSQRLTHNIVDDWSVVWRP